MSHRCAGYYVNCTIQFGQDGSVSSVGNVTRGEFKPNADVAGIGVSFLFGQNLGFVWRLLKLETDKRGLDRLGSGYSHRVWPVC